MGHKVLVVTNMYPEPERPAWGTFIKSQVDSLVKRGVEVDVMVIKGYRNKLEYLWAIPRIWRRCRAHDYVLVHAHYGLSGLVARTQWRLPLLVSYCGDDLYGHSDDRGRPTIQGLPLVWAQRALARFADRVIVKSQRMAALIPAVRADVIPNGVDMSLFRPMSRERCRAALGLQQDATYLLFPYSAARPRKNFKLLQSTIEALNRRHGISSRALVVDNAPGEQMPLYMNAADALVLTSYWEGSPNAIKEAMACNTRIVSVDVGDVRDLASGHPGFEVCSFDADELADALCRSLTNCKTPDTRSTMDWLSTDSIAARIVGIYEAMSTDVRA